MILTVQELLTDAMSLIGATAIDEVPTTSELNLGLRVANMMLNRWQSMPGMLRSTNSVVFTTTGGVADYSIGEWGSDINSQKPIKIFSAYLTDTSTVNYPLDVVDESWLNQINDRNLSSGRPTLVSYDAVSAQQSSPYGVVSLYVIPDTVYTVTLDCSSDVTTFDSLTDNLDFDPSYYEALKYGMAVRLFRHYHPVTVPIPADLLKGEHEANKTLYTMNHKPILAACDLPVTGGSYNVYTDQG